MVKVRRTQVFKESFAHKDNRLSYLDDKVRKEQLFTKEEDVPQVHAKYWVWVSQEMKTATFFAIT